MYKKLLILFFLFPLCSKAQVYDINKKGFSIKLQNEVDNIVIKIYKLRNENKIKAFKDITLDTILTNKDLNHSLRDEEVSKQIQDPAWPNDEYALIDSMHMVPFKTNQLSGFEAVYKTEKSLLNKEQKKTLVAIAPLRNFVVSYYPKNNKLPLFYVKIAQLKKYLSAKEVKLITFLSNAFENKSNLRTDNAIDVNVFDNYHQEIAVKRVTGIIHTLLKRS